jgi:uncharacterized protein involved in copper resistance
MRKVLSLMKTLLFLNSRKAKHPPARLGLPWSKGLQGFGKMFTRPGWVYTLCLMACLQTNTATAQTVEHHHHGHTMPAPSATEAATPNEDKTPADHAQQAAGEQNTPPETPPLEKITTDPPGERPNHTLHLHGDENVATLRFSRLEWVHTTQGSNSTAFEGEASVGSPFNQAVLQAEGEVDKGRLHEARTEVLWRHAIHPFWNLQTGVRFDKMDENRQWAAIGLQGLLPYWFEAEATAYVGQGGRTALRVKVENDWFLTPQWVLHPEWEMNLYGQNDAANHLGSGLASTRLGLRLAYEFNRQFAPYVGVERVSQWGNTQDFWAAQGQAPHETRWVLGLRFWLN